MQLRGGPDYNGPGVWGPEKSIKNPLQYYHNKVIPNDRPFASLQLALGQRKHDFPQLNLQSPKKLAVFLA